jgi:GNAT superfamily N-acetyltransferase
MNLKINNAPDIAGLRFRNIQDESDCAGMAQVHEARKAHDGVDELSSWEVIPTAKDLHDLVSRDHADTLIAEINDEIVGYTTLEWWMQDDSTAVYLHVGYVAPDQRNRGIGSTMIAWAEQRIRELTVQHGRVGKIEFAANGSSSEPDTNKLLLDHGYHVAWTQVDFDFPATHDAPILPLPEGIELRTVTEAHYLPIALCYGAAYRADGISGANTDPQKFADELRREALSRYSDLWQVAWDANTNQVAGLMLVFIEQGVGKWIEVATHPNWQGRGLARALIYRAIRALRERNVKAVRLSTGNDAGAAVFYERVGFRAVKEFPLYRKSFQ